MLSTKQQEESNHKQRGFIDSDLPIDHESSSSMLGKTPDSFGESRHALLERLRSLGINIQAFESLSLGELSDLLYGLNKILSATNKQDENSNRRGSGKGNLLPVLSVTDKRILKALILSAGRVSSLKLSKDLDIPLTTVQRRRKRLEDLFLETSYRLQVEKFGWRRAILFLSTQKGLTFSVAKDLLSWKEPILSVCRTMGANEIDLHAEFIFRHNSELLNLIEKIRTIEGIKNVTWSESIQVIGSNPTQFEFIIDSY
jgi:DNA-binding Lrp family transcriptional regulator